MEGSKVLRYLQGWIAVCALMALGNTVSCFLKSPTFLAEHLFVGAPSLVNGLSARLFGVWTILAAVLRFTCAFHIHNKPIYNLTLFSFVLVFVYLILEVLVYKTATFTANGVLSAMIVSGFSTAWMIVGYWYLDPPDEDVKVAGRGLNELMTTSKKKRS